MDVPGVGGFLDEEVDDEFVDGGVFEGSPHLRQRKTAMGTPQMRWREMHQSGRVATMLVMRSSPQAGSQLTRLISSRARWRKVVVDVEPQVLRLELALRSG